MQSPWILGFKPSNHQLFCIFVILFFFFKYGLFLRESLSKLYFQLCFISLSIIPTTACFVPTLYPQDSYLQTLQRFWINLLEKHFLNKDKQIWTIISVIIYLHGFKPSF